MNYPIVTAGRLEAVEDRSLTPVRVLDLPFENVRRGRFRVDGVAVDHRYFSVNLSPKRGRVRLNKASAAFLALAYSFNIF
jgi:hypothetical protein